MGEEEDFRDGDEPFDAAEETKTIHNPVEEDFLGDNEPFGTVDVDGITETTVSPKSTVCEASILLMHQMVLII